MLWYANWQSGEFQTFVILRVRLPPAVLRFKQPSGGTSVDTQAPECRAPHPKNGAACEFNSRLGYFSKRHCRCDRCPTDRHEVGVLGSIPRPATQCKQRRGWASAQPGLISQDRRVRPPDPLLTKVEYANRQSGKHERLVILQVGRDPASSHEAGVPGSIPGPATTADGPVLSEAS